MDPSGIVVPVVAAKTPPNNVRAGLGEKNVIFQLRGVLAAASTVVVDHRNAARCYATFGVGEPKPVEVAVVIFGFPNDESVVTLQQWAAREKRGGVSGNDKA